ncbi:MAG: 3-methyl-2-oxobutanoate hydroxymethyltransferase [Deltaproteobacteria bacterium]|nr:3-methyl-2-oxobutanoate hydroxymethyltransferase [Deltaproteobacteria bacterium]
MNEQKPEVDATSIKQAGPKRPARITTATLAKKKRDGEPIIMVTAYDATFARLIDEGGADVLLVGDSLGMVIQGEETTLPVTLEDIIYHTRAVRRGAAHAHVVADMPFMSYQTGVREGVESAGRLMKEGQAHSVKLEGGAPFAETVEGIVRAGIPVMGHVGLMPQSVHAMGGFRVQGREPEEARQILRDAKAIEEAGAYAIVLEGIPTELARVITRELSVPTIGIGAGPDCDGQVLVSYDLLGMNRDFVPKFVKRYADLATLIPKAVAEFSAEVSAGAFPSEAHSYQAKGPLFRPTEVRPRLSVAVAEEDDAQIGLYGVPV